MDVSLIPSLEHGAAIRTVIALWKKVSFEALEGKHCFWAGDDAGLVWQKVEDEVIKQVPKLALPESLRNKIIHFIKPIGLEMLKWKVYHDHNYKLFLDLPYELCFTPQRTIDLKKTAEACVKDEKLDIVTRFKLACVWCLESDIKMLWNKLPIYARKCFNEPDNLLCHRVFLITYWSNIIKGEVDRLYYNTPVSESPLIHYQHEFEKAALSGNKVATEYFFLKLTPEERKESLVRTAALVVHRYCCCSQNYKLFLYGFPIESYSEVFCFLLSQIDEEQQMEIFMGHPYAVLRCFLDWPYHSSFIESVKNVMHFVCDSEFEKLINAVVDKAMHYGYRDNNYHKYFEIFWQQDPFKYKRVISRVFRSGSLLSNLFELEDRENITLILNNATIRQKELFIFSDGGKDICEKLILRGNWNLLRFFVYECTSSKEIIVKFREEFLKHKLQNISEGEINKNDFLL